VREKSRPSCMRVRGTFSGHFVSRNRQGISHYALHMSAKTTMTTAILDRSGNHDWNRFVRQFSGGCSCPAAVDLVLGFLSQGKFSVSRGLHSSIAAEDPREILDRVSSTESSIKEPKSFSFSFFLGSS